MYECPVTQPMSAGHQETESSLRSKMYLGAGRAYEIATGRVQHALGLARGTRRIQDVQRVLGIQWLGVDNFRARSRERFVPPDVTASLHRHLVRRIGSIDYEHVAH